MAELSSQPTSVQSVYGWYAANRLFVNRRYQRKLVWSLEEKQKLVESILYKYPIPAILLSEKDDNSGHFEIIDGLQRLNAIISFVEGAFSLPDGRYFNISAFPTAKLRLDEGVFVPLEANTFLSTAEVTTILDYSLAFSVMRKATNEEVDDVFDRINSYGHRLSEQERRQAGSQNEFSELVRRIASKLRGDASPQIMSLSMMPEISIDLPMMKHGYDVKADNVFWCKQGILRATDLRDSMDEQCIADIVASIISGTVLERSKNVLDEIYEKSSPKSASIIGSLSVYGKNKLEDEFFYCIEQIEKICASGDAPQKLRTIIFEESTTNPFPATFSILFIAFHEKFVQEKLSISSYSKLKQSINNITRRLETSRRSTSVAERRSNIDVVKGIISSQFHSVDPCSSIYSDHKTLDIDDYIRRSGMELANYELKQGIVSLGRTREINTDLLDRLLETICGIANNGPNRSGRILIGVSDKEADTQRIVTLDNIHPREVGGRSVVGICREARALNISPEEYHSIIRLHIQNSNLSETLKASVLSSIDFNNYYGLGVVIISIPPQKEPSYFNDKIYWRNGDNTQEAQTAKDISDISRRF